MRINVLPGYKYLIYRLCMLWIDNTQCLEMAKGPTYDDVTVVLYCTRIRWHRGDHVDKSVIPYETWGKGKVQSVEP